MLFFPENNANSKEFVVDPSIAYTAHFRHINCGTLCNKAEFVEEKIMVNMKDDIVKRVNFVLDKLKLVVEKNPATLWATFLLCCLWAKDGIIIVQYIELLIDKLITT